MSIDPVESLLHPIGETTILCISESKKLIRDIAINVLFPMTLSEADVHLANILCFGNLLTDDCTLIPAHHS